jgi:MoaA/NifB/PqqE/SkfB family radical SAM enzyme
MTLGGMRSGRAYVSKGEDMNRSAFANILLSGPCNLRCPACIGSQLDRGRIACNLGRWPLAGLSLFMSRLLQLGVRQVSLTGTDTEPLLYQYPTKLLSTLRSTLAGVQVSLHTNGMLVHRLPHIFNLFDRATVSVPSFRTKTCLAMTGRPIVLDLPAILSVAAIPIKVSTLVTPDNVDELPEIVDRCRKLGIRRMVFRKPWQDSGRLELKLLAGHRPCVWFGGNPVYALDGLQVPVWDFHSTTLPCVNLFADGTLTHDYQLARFNHV